MANLSLPNDWQTRPHQQDFFRYMLQGGLDNKRAVEVWHRRAGKDSCCLNLSAVASQMRVGTIWHMLPTLKQGRKAIWDGIDFKGRRMIDQAFPKEMREGVNNSEMQIRFKNGSVYQVVGSDNYDSLVGTNPVGVIFSEYSIADPAAWDYIRPILAENNGWAAFIYTPRGKNHGKRLYDMALTNSRWHCDLLTVETTRREDGSRVISEQAVQDERDAGMSEEKIQQEFYCSWDSGMEGAFYTAELNRCSQEGRMGDFPHDPEQPCQTFWDIGFRDRTVILITQRDRNGNPIVVDVIHNRNKPLDFYIKELKETGFIFEEHWGPHDMNNTDWVTGKTRVEMAANFGLNVEIVPKLSREDGIDATRAMLRKMKFNTENPNVQMLVDALYAYRREWDEKLNRFRDQPLHDWASDYADSVRYLSVGWREEGHSMSRKTGNARVRRTNVKRSIGSNRRAR